MSLKTVLKRVLGSIQCVRFGVREHGAGVYVGRGCKIVGGGRVCLSDDCALMPSSMLVAHDGGSIKLGARAEVGMFSRVASVGDVTIGDDVITGPGVFIADYNHEYLDPHIPIRLQGNSVRSTEEFPRGGVCVGAGSWIGANVVIVGTVKIGCNCVIGANSVVTRDVPDYCVAVGSPAKVVKRYDQGQGKWIFASSRGQVSGFEGLARK